MPKEFHTFIDIYSVSSDGETPKIIKHINEWTDQKSNDSHDFTRIPRFGETLEVAGRYWEVIHVHYHPEINSNSHEVRVYVKPIEWEKFNEKRKYKEPFKFTQKHFIKLNKILFVVAFILLFIYFLTH